MKKELQKLSMMTPGERPTYPIEVLYGFEKYALLNGKYSKIVAFSGWQYPYTEEQRRRKEIRDNERKNEEPEGTNHALTKQFFTQLFAGRKKWIKPEKTFCELQFSLYMFCPPSRSFSYSLHL